MDIDTKTFLYTCNEFLSDKMHFSIFVRSLPLDRLDVVKSAMLSSALTVACLLTPGN